MKKLKKPKYPFGLLGIAAPQGYIFLKAGDICYPKIDLWWVEDNNDIPNYTEPCIYPGFTQYKQDYPIHHPYGGDAGYIRPINFEKV